MKRMIYKIMLVALVTGLVPAHIVCTPVLPSAGWSDMLRSAASAGLQMVKGAARSGLQSIAQNPGWTSLVIAGVIAKASVYAWYKIHIKHNESELSRLDAIIQARNAARQQTDEKTIDMRELNKKPVSVFARDSQIKEDEQQTEIEGVSGGASAAFARVDAQAQSEVINVGSDGAATGLTYEQISAERASHQQAIKDARLNKLWLPCGGIALVMAAAAFVGPKISQCAGWMGSKI